MEKDFEKIQESIEIGKKIKLNKELQEEENKLNLEKNIKNECVQLKEIFINFINNDFRKGIEKGESQFILEKKVNIPNIAKKYYMNEKPYANEDSKKYNIVDLQYLCEEFNKNDLYLQEFNKKFHINYYNTYFNSSPFEIYTSNYMYFFPRQIFSVKFYTRLL